MKPKQNYSASTVVRFGIHLTMLDENTVNELFVKFLMERDEKLALLKHQNKIQENVKDWEDSFDLRF